MGYRSFGPPEEIRPRFREENPGLSPVRGSGKEAGIVSLRTSGTVPAISFVATALL
jgi:hypothetical protein